MSRTSTTRSHGEGSIYRSDYTRRGSDVTVERWIASVDVGIGPNGERLRKRITGPTRKAVADKLRELQREHDSGVDVRKKSMTVADLAREWLTHLENNEGTKEEGTILRLRPRATKHIVPADRTGGHRLDTPEAPTPEVRTCSRRLRECGPHPVPPFCGCHPPYAPFGRVRVVPRQSRSARAFCVH